LLIAIECNREPEVRYRLGHRLVYGSLVGIGGLAETTNRHIDVAQIIVEQPIRTTLETTCIESAPIRAETPLETGGQPVDESAKTSRSWRGYLCQVSLLVRQKRR